MVAKNFFLLCLIMAIGCSSKTAVVENYGGVDPFDAKTNPIINESYLPEIDGPDEQLSSNKFGPPLESTNEPIQIKKSSRMPTVAVVLGPGLYLGFGHIGILKTLKKYHIPVHMLSAVGFSSIIAAYYATSENLSSAEWDVFKFIQEDDNFWAQDENWKRAIKDRFLKRFLEVNIQDLSLPLILPIFSKKSGKMVYESRGKIAPLLETSIFTSNLQKNTEFESALFHQIFNETELIQKGADIVLFFDVLVHDLALRVNNGFIVGIYSSVIGKIQSERSRLQYYFPVDCGNFEIDSKKDIVSVIKFCEQNSVKLIPEIKKILAHWMDGQQ